MKTLRMKSRLETCFTLIELLITIAIIAILASMLLPALNKARKSAQQTKCISNLKQWATAEQGYLGDYNDYFPPAGQLTNAISFCWTDFLSEELGKRTLVMNTYRYFVDRLNRNAIHSCPSETQEDNANSASFPDYLYNRRLCPSYKADGTLNVGGNPPYAIYKAAKVPKPGRTLYLIDGIRLTDAGGSFAGVIYSIEQTKYGTASSSIYVNYARHLGKTNVSFVDGHCESRNHPAYGTPLDVENHFGTATDWWNNYLW